MPVPTTATSHLSSSITTWALIFWGDESGGLWEGKETPAQMQRLSTGGLNCHLWSGQTAEVLAP